jgi:hypothetical protein
MKVKVGVQSPHGACSYYRTMGVLSKLRKLNPNISIELITEIEWHLIADADVLYLERPANANFHKACTIAKDYNVPLWIDYDDNLFDVPPYNPAYENYSKKQTKEVLASCIKMADVVTVTTKELQIVYGNLNKNIKVVENAFNDYNYKLEKKPSKNESLCWRGSRTHRNDLLGVLDEMVELSNKYEDWGWCFVGSDLWYVTDNIANHYQTNELPQLKFFKFMKNTNAAIQLAPLAFNRFNVGKSNIAWLEGVFAGSCCIAPHLPEWEKPGIETYKNRDEFKSKLDMLMRDKKKRERNFKDSRKYIVDNLLLSNINRKRLEILEGLK